MAKITILPVSLLIWLSCMHSYGKQTTPQHPQVPTGHSLTNTSDTTAVNSRSSIITGNTTPEELIAFSKTLKGTTYKYGSSDPKKGFDCSGFITYVFNHFGIKVPRTSVGFTNEGKEVKLTAAKPGDLILFTGTDSTIRTVGHMGIITKAGDNIVFIHATSGKAYSVTETTLNAYYMGRFVKVISVFGNTSSANGDKGKKTLRKKKLRRTHVKRAVVRPGTIRNK